MKGRNYGDNRGYAKKILKTVAITAVMLSRRVETVAVTAVLARDFVKLWPGGGFVHSQA